MPVAAPGGTGTHGGAVIVVRGSADTGVLARQLPGVPVHVVERLDEVPATTAEAVVALVLRSGTALPEEVLARFPALVAVVRPGSGIDNIDVSALRRRGIALRREPGLGAPAVAEWVVLAALMLCRRAAFGYTGLAAGQHRKADCIGVPLHEQRVAVWGAGPVGRAVGAALGPSAGELAFAAWPSADPALPQRDPDDLTRWADIHVVALPLRDTTRGMFGAAWLTAVGERTPAVICAGRLAVVDVAALLSALGRGALSGLALDPVEAGDTEVVRQALEKPGNFFASPHIGAQRADVRRSYDAWVVRQLRPVVECPTTDSRGPGPLPDPGRRQRR